jgi:hypothetical protein
MVMAMSGHSVMQRRKRDVNLGEPQETGIGNYSPDSQILPHVSIDLTRVLLYLARAMNRKVYGARHYPDLGAGNGFGVRAVPRYLPASVDPGKANAEMDEKTKVFENRMRSALAPPRLSADEEPGTRRARY